MKNGDSFFHQPNATSSGFGFVGSLSFYYPVLSAGDVLDFDLGIQNRLTLTSNDSHSFAMDNPHLSARIEFWRMYVGAGYAPYTFVSKPGEGITSLHTNPDQKSYFVEGGLIWRVIPEFQVAATYALEFGLPSGGGISPTSAEYGLRFRFPLNPTELGRGGKVDYDGRYPFGFMK